MSLPIDQVRALFPHTQSQIYLNHAAISPYSTHVVESMQAFIQQRHLDKIENYYFMLPKMQELRERIARFINAPSPDNIAFVGNTSDGLSLLANGLYWEQGDRILLNSMEFPSNVYPFLNLCQYGMPVDFVQPRDYVLHLDDFEAAITPQTALLSVSQVQFLSGQAMDLVALGELCRHYNLVYCVDAIQALGATDIDVQALGIDFLATGGHKWLMGEQGLGFVYISPRILPYLRNERVGWLSVENAWNLLDYQLDLRTDAARFETGTFNAMGMVALLASLQVFDRWPMADITAHVQSLSTHLITALQDLGLSVITPMDQKLGIVTCLHPQADAIFEALAAQQIHVSAREGQYLRFAPHFYNSHDELEQTIQALKKLL